LSFAANRVVDRNQDDRQAAGTEPSADLELAVSDDYEAVELEVGVVLAADGTAGTALVRGHSVPRAETAT